MNLVNNNKTIVARCGLRTNGDIHVGNMLPILTGFIIGKKLAEKGKKLKFIIMLVDLEQNKDQKPFVYQKDGDKCHISLSRHAESIIISFVEDLKNIYPETEIVFCRVSEFIKIEQVKNKIVNLLETNDYQSKIGVVCNKCHNVADIIKVEKGMIKYICMACNHIEEISVKIAEFALEHTFLGALENYYFKPNLHIIGRDHAIRKDGVSNIEKGNFYLDQFSNKTYLPKKILTTLILGRNNKKMSKSERNGLFLTELKSKYGAFYLKKLIKMAHYFLINKIEVIKFKEMKKLFEK